MSKFEVGDRVVRDRDSTWPESHGYAGVEYFVTERGKAVSKDGHEIDCRSEGYYSLVHSSPVREVTRKEIVPGVYGAVHVGAPTKDRRIYVNVGGFGMTMQQPYYSPQDLREAATVFSQLADALEHTS